MGYTFEIFDKNDKLSRRGHITGDSIDIPYTDEDGRFVIRYDDYPYAIYKEGILHGKASATHKEDIGAYVIEIGDTIEVQISNPKEIVYHEVHGNVTKYQGKRSLKLPRTPGKHFIYNQDRSNKMEFICAGESTADRIIKAAHSESQIVHANIIGQQAINEGWEGQEAILNYMAERIAMNDWKSVHDIYLILKQYESVINTRNMLNTGTIWAIDNDLFCEIKGKEEIDNVIVYKIVNKQKIHLTSFHTNKKTEIVAEDHSSLLIEGYKGTSFVSARIASIIPHSVRSQIWTEKRKERDAYLYAIEKGILLNDSSIHADIEQIVYLQNQLEHPLAFADRPILTERIKDRLELYIPDMELLNSMSDVFYIAFSRVSAFGSPSRVNRTRIEDEYVMIDTYESGIPETEDIFIWIENENGISVSESIVLFADSEKRESLDDIADEHWLAKYESSIMKAIKEHDNVGYDKVVRKIMEDKMTEEGVGIRSILSDLIYQFFKQNLWEKSWYIMRLFIELRQGSGSIGTYFFDEDIQYRESNRELYLPETRRSYLMIVEEFYESDEARKVVYVRNPESYEVTGSYAIVRFLDLNGYESSGYIMIGGQNKKPVYTTERLNVRVI